ncbi:MAG: transporter substrate-binding domain-containing protein [Rhizobiales bacterium]|nr:transporter substrate-binding domain-containing protein [Hyphomicrobiales bacterium]
MWRRASRLFALSMLLAATPLGSVSAGPDKVTIPLFQNPNTITTAGSIATIRTIRFLTTDDYPPFNFIDQEGRLGGFNIALARAVCLEIKARCTMQALAWENLQDALDRGQGDAIIAGIAVSDKSVRRLAFTEPYLRIPARFFAARGFAEAPSPGWPDRISVGVQAGTAHEAFLKAFFPKAQLMTFADQSALHAAVRSGAATLGFSDGVGIAFWFQSGDAAGCCDFVGGPYLNADYFGPGVSIAMPLDRPDLKEVLDEALRRLTRKGTFSEIFLRSFPVSFF